jgi:hypothetical protein
MTVDEEDLVKVWKQDGNKDTGIFYEDWVKKGQCHCHPSVSREPTIQHH